MIFDASAEGSEVWFLNRGVFVVRAREPYAEWADSLDDTGVRYADDNAWVNAYLVPEFEFEEESWEWLQENCSVIFEMELGGWHTDPDAWPRDRSWKVFREWFEVEFIQMAWDLVDAPLSSEPGGPYRP